MRLKSIKLAGFKSFVDPTTVQFPSNMSAVVGPNGCGKSNVIDAVRWVMGESSAKNLRGESMTDVIFNGSNARKPVGQASIELVFDNTDKTLTGEYAAFNEISIRRKVTRDGDSSYFLNGTKCRRRDITDIFLGTGLGPRSYAIIEQGMISKLIEAKPEELRVFIEEAAGISRYKERRRDTENRIRRTRDNLERLTDIRDELERQLQHLNRQAKTAERYKVLKEEERQKTALLRAIEWQALAAKKAAGETVINEHKTVLEATVAEKVKAETGIEKQRVNLAEQSEAFNKVQSDYYAIGADIARNEQQINTINQRKQQLEQDTAQVQQALAEAKAHIVSDKDLLQNAEAELLEIAPALEVAKEKEQIATDAFDTAQADLQEWQLQWEQFNATAAEAKQKTEVEQSRIQYVEQAQNKLLDRANLLRAEKNDLSKESFVSDLEDLKQEIETARTGLEQKTQVNEDATQQIEALRQSVNTLSKQIADVNSVSQQTAGRLSGLEAIQQNATSQGDDAEAWLASENLASAKRLTDAIKVDAGWEKAVETVLGHHLQAVIVDDYPALMQNGLPAAGVTLWDDSQPTGQVAAATNSLAEKVNHSGVAGMIGAVRCAETLDEALALKSSLAADESVIVPEGIWLGSNWVRMLNDGDGDSILKRQVEIDALQVQTLELETQRSQIEAEHQQQIDKLQESEQTQRNVQREIAELNSEITQQTSALSSMQAREEKVLARLKQLDDELDEIEQQLELEQQTLAEHRLQLQGYLDAMAEQMEVREQRLSERDEKRAVLEDHRDRARAHKDELMNLSIRHQGLKTQLESAQQTSARMEQQLGALEERQEMLLIQSVENIEPLEELKEGLEEKLQRRLLVEEEMATARTQMGVIEADIRNLESNRSKAEQASQGLRNKLEQARLDVQTLTVQLANVLQLITESGNEPEALLHSAEPLPEEAQLRSALEHLQNSISRLGAINLAAIDEYDQQSERKLYLDAQNEDLLAALETLENAIRKIDRETRSRFKETFDEVNAGLTELFPQVFGGGQAYLELTGEDLLDTGIAIMARPPGKKNSTIHLLSGGEKALTAIALVFAIFQLNPAPFCMLDEVDAPLDDANVGRYARLVKKMSEKVQFIYITHNKIPMEYADQLMGVTMHEAGVSRLVTVDIDKAAELAAL